MYLVFRGGLPIPNDFVIDVANVPKPTHVVDCLLCLCKLAAHRKLVFHCPRTHSAAIIVLKYYQLGNLIFTLIVQL